MTSWQVSPWKQHPYNSLWPPLGLAAAPAKPSPHWLGYWGRVCGGGGAAGVAPHTWRSYRLGGVVGKVLLVERGASLSYLPTLRLTRVSSVIHPQPYQRGLSRDPLNPLQTSLAYPAISQGEWNARTHPATGFTPFCSHTCSPKQIFFLNYQLLHALLSDS